MKLFKQFLLSAIILQLFITIILAQSSESSTGPSLPPSSTGNNDPLAPAESDEYKNIILIVVIAVSALISIFLIYKIYKLHHETHDNSIYANPSKDSQATQASVNDETTKRNWKIDAGDIEIGEVIGQGSMGKIYKGKWRGLIVAIKELIHTAKEDTIQSEMSVLIKVRHPNLVLFMGIAQPSPEKLHIINEYMSRGNLYTVLHDKTLKFDWRRRIQFAIDTARAMNYLHCSKPPIFHNNLNSINILIDKEFVAKISDYSLDSIKSQAKKSGVYTQPLWIAPEIFKKNKPSKAADVYSFGIILWEILTRKTPYQGKIKANNNVKTIQQISEGLRPEIPKKCPSRYAELMQKCWSSDPNKRPTFETIVSELLELEKEKINVDLWESVEIKIETPDEKNKLNQANNPSPTDKTNKDNNSTPTLPSLQLLAADKKPWMLSHDELKYENIIGSGSFGEVWLGYFRGKKVAIKKLMLTLNNQNNINDFIRELNIMCSLRHPNCVLFMGACLEPNNQCIVMEFCEKGNLFNLLHDVSQPIDYNLILKILIEIGEGILYLHLNKPPILHRDLKSLNILLDEHMSVKVSDFGLTDFKPDQPAGEGKASNLQLGTPFWLAPEVMQDGAFTEAADVYSFGMIIWELFTREVPFPNMNPHQAALAVITEDKRPDIPAFVPPKFVSLIQDCWSRNIQQRPHFPDIIQRLQELKREGLPRIELSLKNAALYRKKTTVFAFKSKDTVIVYKTWGTGESKKGDWVLVGPGDDVYTCDAAIFAKTYGLVSPDKPHLYRKTGNIFALEMKHDFLMQTLEGMEHGAAGDWIAQNPVDGEQWPIDAKTFASMYELDPIQEISSNLNSNSNKDNTTKVLEEKENKQNDEEYESKDNNTNDKRNSHSNSGKNKSSKSDGIRERKKEKSNT